MDKPESLEVRTGSVNFHHYISLRHFGPYETVNDTWARLLLFAFNNGFSGKDVTAFGLCYDDPTQTPSEQIRYDACLAVPQEHFAGLQQVLRSNRPDQNRPEIEGIRLEELGGLRNTLTVTHKGPYQQNRRAYSALVAETTRRGGKGRRLDLPSIEIYRNNPLLTRAEDLITEIHVRGAQ
jgi:AraC family transcriptional regulator